MNVHHLSCLTEKKTMNSQCFFKTGAISPTSPGCLQGPGRAQAPWSRGAPGSRMDRGKKLGRPSDLPPCFTCRRGCAAKEMTRGAMLTAIILLSMVILVHVWCANFWIRLYIYIYIYIPYTWWTLIIWTWEPVPHCTVVDLSGLRFPMLDQ